MYLIIMVKQIQDVGMMERQFCMGVIQETGEEFMPGLQEWSLLLSLTGAGDYIRKGLS